MVRHSEGGPHVGRALWWDRAEPWGHTGRGL